MPCLSGARSRCRCKTHSGAPSPACSPTSGRGLAAGVRDAYGRRVCVDDRDAMGVLTERRRDPALLVVGVPDQLRGHVLQLAAPRSVVLDLGLGDLAILLVGMDAGRLVAL